MINLKSRAINKALKDSIMNTDADKNTESTFITNPNDGVLDYVIGNKGLGKYIDEIKDMDNSDRTKLRSFFKKFDKMFDKRENGIKFLTSFESQFITGQSRKTKSEYLTKAKPLKNNIDETVYELYNNKQIPNDIIEFIQLLRKSMQINSHVDNQ